MSNSTHDSGNLFNAHYNGLPAIIPADDGVMGALDKFQHVAPMPVCGNPQPANAPVPVAMMLDAGIARRLARGGREFFKAMLSPTVKHV